LNDLNGARQRLLLLLEEDLGIAERADVLAEIGALWEHEYRPARAGASWLAAAEADPESPQSVERRAAAAAAFGEAGRVQKATRLWVEVVQADERWRARGNLARAGLMLAQGRPTQALPLYEDVVRVGDDDERAAGRLGASVCLERLGNLDEALAEIDAAELPDGVRATRANSLRARQYWAP